MNNIEKSTQILREEHRLMECATLAFADIIKELQRGDALDHAARSGRSPNRSRPMLGDGITRRKIFSCPWCVLAEVALLSIPGALSTRQHQHIQPLLAHLEGAAHEYLQAAHGTPESLVRSLRNIIDFYPGHMWKADHLLFPLANELLSEVDQVVLLQQFDWIESVIDSDMDEQLRAIVAEFRPEPRTA